MNRKLTDRLTERMDEILPKITSDEFLEAKGLGNEIAFFIFEYPAEAELEVRKHIHFLLDQIPKRKPDIRLKHINLFEFVVDHLRRRNLLEKTFEMQRQKGDEFVLRQLGKVLHPQKLVPEIAEEIQPQDHDLVLVSGVGSVWPMMRTHSLLNNLHPIMGRTPLVLFYPGRYDQRSLQLFGRIESDNYYRAFRLVP